MNVESAMLWGIHLLRVAVLASLTFVLATRYLETRQAGFLWLGAALVLWPIAIQLIDHFSQTARTRLVTGQPVTLFPFSLVAKGHMSLIMMNRWVSGAKQFVGLALAFVGVLVLRIRPKAT